MANKDKKAAKAANLANKAKEQAAKKEPVKTQATAPVAKEAPKADPVPAKEPVVNKKEEKQPTPAPAAAPAAKTPDPAPAPAPAPAANPTPKVENPEVIVPEVVDTTPKKEEVALQVVGTLGSNLSKIGNDGKDRIDKNHAIDLMKMTHSEYITNPSVPAEKAQAIKKQFDVMHAMALVQYFGQLEEDMQSMGIRIKPEMRESAEYTLCNLLGVKTKTIKGDDGQLYLQFVEVPKETKEKLKEESKIENAPIPEPDPKMTDAQKRDALRTIFAQKKEGGIGGNLLKGIEWARNAYSFTKEEKKSVVLAHILKNGPEATAINCFRSMVTGKLNSEHSILGAHALLKCWCQGLPDQEISELIQVIASAALEKKIEDWNSRADATRQSNVDNEFAIYNRSILAANASNVIDGILSNKEDVVAEYPDKTGNLTIHTDAVRKTLIAAYGDSDSLLKAKLEELVKYYLKPVARLSSYIDKSAYAEKK